MKQPPELMPEKCHVCDGKEIVPAPYYTMASCPECSVVLRRSQYLALMNRTPSPAAPVEDAERAEALEQIDDWIDGLTVQTVQKAADNLRAAAVGKPAKIKWPHRVLHEGAEAIEELLAIIKRRALTTLPSPPPAANRDALAALDDAPNYNRVLHHYDGCENDCLVWFIGYWPTIRALLERAALTPKKD